MDVPFVVSFVSHTDTHTHMQEYHFTLFSMGIIYGKFSIIRYGNVQVGLCGPDKPVSTSGPYFIGGGLGPTKLQTKGDYGPLTHPRRRRVSHRLSVFVRSMGKVGTKNTVRTTDCWMVVEGR